MTISKLSIIISAFNVKTAVRDFSIHKKNYIDAISPYFKNVKILHCLTRPGTRSAYWWNGTGQVRIGEDKKMKKQTNFNKVLQLKVTLTDSSPKVWRRILVPETTLFLNCIAPSAMLWAGVTAIYTDFVS